MQKRIRKQLTQVRSGKKGRRYKEEAKEVLGDELKSKLGGKTQRSQKERWRLKKVCIDLNVLGTCRISIIFSFYSKKEQLIKMMLSLLFILGPRRIGLISLKSNTMK